MLKKRSLQVRVVKDDDLDETYEHVTVNAHEVSDAVIDVLKEGTKAVAKVIFVYMALDTYRQVAVAVAKR